MLSVDAFSKQQVGFGTGWNSPGGAVGWNKERTPIKQINNPVAGIAQQIVPSFGRHRRPLLSPNLYFSIFTVHLAFSYECFETKLR